MKARRNGKRLDRVAQDLLTAVRVSDEEISNAADSPDLYDGLLVRIAAEPAQPSVRRITAEDGRAGERGRLDLGTSLWARPSLRWTLTAAAVLLLAALAVLILLPRQSSQPVQISPVIPLLVPSSPGGGQPVNATRDSPERVLVARNEPAPGSAVRTSHRHHRRDSNAAEVATDFFPLTFTADSPTPESGHVVRVKIARTALIAFGLPMNHARAGELITADVVIGDDGLARAIRFVQ